MYQFESMWIVNTNVWHCNKNHHWKCLKTTNNAKMFMCYNEMSFGSWKGKPKKKNYSDTRCRVSSRLIHNLLFTMKFHLYKCWLCVRNSMLDFILMSVIKSHWRWIPDRNKMLSRNQWIIQIYFWFYSAHTHTRHSHLCRIL